MNEEAALGTKYKPRTQPVERPEIVYIAKAQAKSVAARTDMAPKLPRPIFKPTATPAVAPVTRGRTIGRVLRRVGTYDPELAHAELHDRIILDIEHLGARSAVDTEYTLVDAAKYLAEEDTVELDKLPPLVVVDRMVGRTRSRSRSKGRAKK